MEPSTTDPLSSLAILDGEAKKQRRMFLWIGLALVSLALVFPVASIVSSIPLWVAGIMFVCAGLLGAVCILLAFTRGSPVLAPLRTTPTDPVVRARFWVVVQRGVRSLELLCTTRGGTELSEVLFVNAGADEERVIGAFQRVVPTVEPG